MNLYFSEKDNNKDGWHALVAEAPHKGWSNMYWWITNNIKKEEWYWEWYKDNTNWHAYYFKNKEDATLVMMTCSSLDEDE